MKKVIILVISSLITLLGIQAQSVQTFYWGYCDASILGGVSSTSHAKAAIYIPAEISQLYKGYEITSVRIGLANRPSSATVFVTKNLDEEPAVSKTQNSPYSGWGNIRLGNSYTIDGEPFYVGYEVDGENCIGYTNFTSENGFWVNLGDGWKDYSSDPNLLGYTLALQFRIQGKEMPKDLWLTSIDEALVEKGKPVTLSGTVYNRSPYTLRKYQIAYQIDDAEEKVADFKCTLGSNVSQTFSIETDAFDEAGTHTVKYRISAVGDGIDDYVDNNAMQGVLRIVNRIPQKRMVVEEYTGLKCSYCPQGIVAFEYMYDKYPNNFVGIAVHGYGNDPLTASSYAAFPLNGGSAPNCIVDRDENRTMIPQKTSLQATYEKLAAIVPAAEVEVEAAFDDSEGTNSTKQIKVKATTTFYKEVANPRYRLAFVVVENGVSGYYQANYYAGSSIDMGGFEYLPSYASIDMDHVAREIYGYNGIEGSVPTSITIEEPMTYETVLTTPQTVQTPENINVIALLINSSTGIIENAAEAKIGSASVPSAISTVKQQSDYHVSIINGKAVVDSFAGTLQIYSVSGSQIANGHLQRGVYIIKGVLNGKTAFTKRVVW